MVVRSVISVALIGAGVAIFAALGHGNPPGKREARAASKPIVEVQPVEQHAGGIDFEVDGVVVPFREIEVPAEVAGRIAFRSENCRIGHTVKQGELLVRIAPEDYDLEVRRLEEQEKQAQAELKELEVDVEARRRQIELAEEDLAITQRDLARVEKLRAQHVTSEAEIDAAKLNELQARDAVQTETDQLALLEASRERLTSACALAARQLEKARLELSRTEIASPIDGVITQETIEQGCYVQRGGVVAVIQDTSSMEVRCSLQMKEMHWIWQSSNEGSGPSRRENPYHFPRTPVTVVYAMSSARIRWRGVLQYYEGAQVDERTRMVPCRVRVDAPSEAKVESASAAVSAPALMAGMFVTVRVHSKPAIPLLELPEAAVQPGGTVWTVKDGRLHEVPVRVAHATPEEVIAYADETGLAAEDLVVVSPLAAPVENAAVTLLGEE